MIPLGLIASKPAVAIDWLFTANFAGAAYVLQGEAEPYLDLFMVDETNWGPPAVITPGVGVTTGGDAIAATPTGLLLASGGTLVMGFTVATVPGVDGFEVQLFNAPTYDKFVSILVNTQVGGSRIADEAGPGTNVALAHLTSTGAHKVAFAFESGRIAASVDGGAAATLAYSHFGTFTEIAMTQLNGGVLTSLNAIAEAVDDAMLATLSAP